MKRGRPSTQSPGVNQGRKSVDNDDNQKGSPQKKNTAKLPPLTEEQIKARFEGMTTRHKKGTPVRKLLDGSDSEEEGTKSIPNTPKRPKVPEVTKSVPKRGRGRPPKNADSIIAKDNALPEKEVASFQRTRNAEPDTQSDNEREAQEVNTTVSTEQTQEVSGEISTAEISDAIVSHSPEIVQRPAAPTVHTAVPEVIRDIRKEPTTAEMAKTVVDKLKSRLAPPAASVPESIVSEVEESVEDMPASNKPQQKESASQAPVTVNIVLKDQNCLPYMTDVGMHILYYCKHCTFYSQQLLTVIEHIKECPTKGTEDSNACKEDDVAEYLENVAIGEIREERKEVENETHVEKKKSIFAQNSDDLLEQFERGTASIQKPDGEIEEAVNDDSDEEWTPMGKKYAFREDIAEYRLQRMCEICGKPVFSFSVKRHMETHARKEAEVAAKEKAKAIALGLDKVTEAGDAQVDDNVLEPMDTETHLSVETNHSSISANVIESGAAAIAVPAQPEIPSTHIEADVSETDNETATGSQVRDPSTSNSEDQSSSNIDLPKTIPKGLALKKTLFPCKLHELYFVSHEALTEHFVEEHWKTDVDIVTMLPHNRRGRGRPKGSGKIRGSDTAVPARPGITPDEEAAAVAMSVMRHSKLGWSRQKVNPTRGGPVKCNICYKKFSTNFRLEMHRTRTHTEDKMKPLPCQACGKLFRNQVQRRNHYRIVHEGKKRIQSKSIKKREKKIFICDLCGYSTPDNSRLKNHIMSVHQGIMPYACDQCDYKCNEKSDIVRHKHKHLGIKRYQCEYCNYKADQRWLLVNHCAKQHSIQLPRISRNTRGGYFSLRNKKRRDGMQQHLNPLQWLLQQESGTTSQVQISEQKGANDVAETEAAHAVLELGDVSGEAGEQVTVYIEEVVEDGNTVEAYTEGQELSVEELQRVVNDSKPGEVMYVREDGTVLEPEEAALLLMSVNTPGSNIQIEEVEQDQTQIQDGQKEIALIL